MTFVVALAESTFRINFRLNFRFNFLNQLTDSNVISHDINCYSSEFNEIMPSTTTSEYEVLGRVAGGLAHDLNNHLSPILLGVQTLQRHEPDEKTMRILMMIEQAARKASELLRHVLDYSRDAREGGGGVLSRNDVVALLMDHSQAMLGTSTGVVVKDGTAWTLPSDHRVLSMLVTSLLQNAIDAGSAVNEVTLEMGFEPASTSPESGAWISPRDRMSLVVMDAGSGMSPEVAASATHPFFTTRSANGNSGLGLFLVHTVVKQLNGGLQIFSDEGRGTSVKILLPVTAVQKS